MFSLRDSPSISSSSTEDSFGWWIGIEAHSEPRSTPPRSSSPRGQPVSEADELSTSSGGSCAEGQRALACDLAVTADGERCASVEAELIELCSLHSSESDDEERPICYTPERLVRSNEFRILTPAPRDYPTLSDLIRESAREGKAGRQYCRGLANPGLFNGESIDERIGFEQLAALLRSPDQEDSSTRTSSIRCCCIQYGSGEVLLHTEHCPANLENKEIPSTEPPTRPYYSEYGSCCDISRVKNENSAKVVDDGDELADDTSGVSSVDASSEISCSEVEANCDDKLTRVPRRLSDELAYVSFEYPVTTPDSQQDKEADATEVVSILASLECEPSEAEATLLEEDRFRTATQSSHDCVARLALSIEPDDRRLPSARATDQERELELVRERLERLQGSSRHLLEQIFSLRRDFSRDEWKVDQLSESVSKLRNEVYELRYLDDLLKLLKGELDRISNKKWPFTIRHISRETDEINLVV